MHVHTYIYIYIHTYIYLYGLAAFQVLTYVGSGGAYVQETSISYNL